MNAAGRLVDRTVQLRKSFPQAVPPGAYDWDFPGMQVDLRLVIGDASEPATWESHLGACAGAFQAIYFDPFSPKTNAELWTEEILRRGLSVLCPGGRLVSYCVNRTVQRALASVGFVVSKTAGPPLGKREVLIATRPAAP